MQGMLTHVVVHQPEDPIAYFHEELSRIKKEVEENNVRLFIPILWSLVPDLRLSNKPWSIDILLAMLLGLCVSNILVRNRFEAHVRFGELRQAKTSSGPGV